MVIEHDGALRKILRRLFSAEGYEVDVISDREAGLEMLRRRIYDAALGNFARLSMGDQIVGKYTSQGVLAHVDQDPGTSCRVTVDSNAQPQAFWLFSVNACGAYGFRDLKILQSGHTEPLGEVTLTSNGKIVKLGKGSAMLLRVDSTGPEDAQARTTPSRETGQ